MQCLRQQASFPNLFAQTHFATAENFCAGPGQEKVQTTRIRQRHYSTHFSFCARWFYKLHERAAFLCNIYRNARADKEVTNCENSFKDRDFQLPYSAAGKKKNFYKLCAILPNFSTRKKEFRAMRRNGTREGRSRRRQRRPLFKTMQRWTK